MNEFKKRITNFFRREEPFWPKDSLASLALNDPRKVKLVLKSIDTDQMPLCEATFRNFAEQEVETLESVSRLYLKIIQDRFNIDTQETGFDLNEPAFGWHIGRLVNVHMSEELLNGILIYGAHFTLSTDEQKVEVADLCLDVVDENGKHRVTFTRYGDQCVLLHKSSFQKTSRNITGSYKAEGKWRGLVGQYENLPLADVLLNLDKVDLSDATKEFLIVPFRKMISNLD